MRFRQRGGVFIVALAVLVGLVAIVASIAATQRVAIRAQINRTEADRARIAAEAAVQRAIAEIGTIAPNEPTTLQDAWATLGDSGNSRFRIGNTTFRLQILDASSRLNLNTATQPVLERLPLTQEQIDAILDWREGNAQPRPGGAKDEFYNNLPRPYNAKLRRFDTVDELLQVRGFTARTLYEPITDVVSSTNTTQDPVPLSEMLVVDSYSAQTTPTGQTKINVNAGNVTAAQIAQRIQAPLPIAQAIVAGRPYARLGDVLVRPGVNPALYRNILDNLTTNGAPRLEGRINLNTVTEPILNAIPNVTPDVVQAILSRQGQGFTSLGEIATIPGLNSGPALQPVADLFSTSSQSFLIRAVGEAGESTVAIEALVVIENEQPRLFRMQAVPYDDFLERWGWVEEPNGEIVLREAA